MSIRQTTVPLRVTSKSKIFWSIFGPWNVRRADPLRLIVTYNMNRYGRLIPMPHRILFEHETKYIIDNFS